MHGAWKQATRLIVKEDKKMWEPKQHYMRLSSVQSPEDTLSRHHGEHRHPSVTSVADTRAGQLWPLTHAPKYIGLNAGLAEKEVAGG